MKNIIPFLFLAALTACGQFKTPQNPRIKRRASRR